jgi:hypothetical protein
VGRRQEENNESRQYDWWKEREDEHENKANPEDDELNHHKSFENTCGDILS